MKRSPSTGWSRMPSTARAVFFQRDQRAPFMPPGDEGARAVHRIEHPAIAALPGRLAEFLAQDAVVRPLARDQVARMARSAPRSASVTGSKIGHALPSLCATRRWACGKRGGSPRRWHRPGVWANAMDSASIMYSGRTHRQGSCHEKHRRDRGFHRHRLGCVENADSQRLSRLRQRAQKTKMGRG